MYSQNDRRYGKPGGMTFKRAPKPTYFVFVAMVLRKSAKGVLVQRCGRRDRAQVWLPASNIRLESPDRLGHMRVAVPSWLFEAKPELQAA
jgi:hypothetical protein